MYRLHAVGGFSLAALFIVAQYGLAAGPVNKLTSTGIRGANRKVAPVSYQGVVAVADDLSGTVQSVTLYVNGRPDGTAKHLTRNARGAFDYHGDSTKTYPTAEPTKVWTVAQVVYKNGKRSAVISKKLVWPTNKSRDKNQNQDGRAAGP